MEAAGTPSGNVGPREVGPPLLPGEVVGVRSGKHVTRRELRSAAGPHIAHRPFRVRRPVPIKASELPGDVVARLTEGYLAAPDVAASYFRFHELNAYVVDLCPLGMIVRAENGPGGVLQERGYVPGVRTRQYGPVEKRLTVPRAVGGRLRLTTFERGYGRLPAPGCWAGDFSPAYGYKIYVHEGGLVVVPHRSGEEVNLDSDPSLPAPDYGLRLGRIRVSLPRPGLDLTERDINYLCY